MTIQNFYANTEILHSDMNDISGSLLCDLYDNLVRMGFARFSNHGCFGESFNVTRDTGTSVVIQKGLGFCFVPNGSETFPKYQQVVLPNDITFTLNPAGNTLPRIDLLVAKPKIVDAAKELRNVKEADGSINASEFVIRSAWSYEIEIITGLEANDPKAPDTPEGTLPLAELLMRENSGLESQENITDVRYLIDGYADFQTQIDMDSLIDGELTMKGNKTFQDDIRVNGYINDCLKPENGRLSSKPPFIDFQLPDETLEALKVSSEHVGIESIAADEFTIHQSVGACLTSSGKLLILPTGTVDELVLYDPASKLTRQIQTSQSLGDAGYINGVLASNNKIYSVTSNTFGNLQKGFFVVDCAELESLDNTYRTDVFTAFTDPSHSFKNAGVNASNGKIYFAPSESNSIGIIDTKTDRYYEISCAKDSTGSGGGYMGACIGKDGKVYFIPHDNTKTRSILVLDPANDTTEVFGNISDASYTSAVLAEDGCIYAMPADEKNAVLKIDTSTKVLTKLYPESGKFSAGYAGCSIGPDGRIVAVCNYLLDAPKPYLAVIDVKNQKVFEYDTHIDG